MELVTGGDQEQASSTPAGSRVKGTMVFGLRSCLFSPSMRNAAELGALVKICCFFHLNLFKYAHYFLLIEI